MCACMYVIYLRINLWVIKKRTSIPRAYYGTWYHIGNPLEDWHLFNFITSVISFIPWPWCKTGKVGGGEVEVYPSLPDVSGARVGRGLPGSPQAIVSKRSFDVTTKSRPWRTLSHTVGQLCEKPVLWVAVVQKDKKRTKITGEKPPGRAKGPCLPCGYLVYKILRGAGVGEVGGRGPPICLYGILKDWFKRWIVIQVPREDFSTSYLKTDNINNRSGRSYWAWTRRR